ncbi:MAG: Asp-tRNA(Asn)/Glu-tRNA(Gln) amidotransferase subunit GatB [Candidatus Andersenbacteria bacterium]|nr:Asp-tRNA(Asn)/Glu-tRNA(Gln) amidotransferase subunit GatB [Candidatus Andersenbacteria bacterium]
MELEPIIGLEIHVQLTTKSKMFCSCANIFGDVPPNTAICPICMGYPGTLPVPNKQAIDWIQKAGAALNCELAQESRFDRKHYFYPDLPKGYQISQFDKPFCGKGHLTIDVDGQEKTIGITRIHLEEDAAKNTHPKGADYTLVDYNRAGTPLIEIVTEPDIRTPAEAKAFLQELQRIMRTLGISTADMEKGQMRADANISLRPALQQGEARPSDGRPVDKNKLYPKTEVKNVNSFKFVEKALAHEIERQTKMWEAGETPTHATRGFDSNTGKTTLQRTKEEAADYRYFPEPDIPSFSFAKEELETIKEHLPELPRQKILRLVGQTGVARQHAALLTEEKVLADFFEEVVSELEQLDNERVEVSRQEIPILMKLAVSVILRDVRKMAQANNVTGLGDLKLNAENFAELMALLHAGKINNQSVGKVVEEMHKTGGDPDAIIQNLGLEQVSGADDLQKIVDEVVSEQADTVAKIKAGKEAAIQFLMGQVMAKSSGKANPKTIIEMLRKTILG